MVMHNRSELTQQIITTVGAWDGIAVEAHRFGGQQFNMGNVEIGHIHSNGMVDIPFTRNLRAVLVAEGHAEPHHLLPDSGWISYYVRTPDDVHGALWLYALSWRHKQRARVRRDPDQLAVIEAALLALNPSPMLQTVLG